MKKISVLGALLVLLTWPILCGFSFAGIDFDFLYSDSEIQSAQEKLDLLFEQDCMGYDLAYMYKGNVKNQVSTIFLDFDEGKQTWVTDKHKGKIGEYEHEYFISTDKIDGNIVDGWYEISSSGEPGIRYSLIEKEGKQYVYTETENRHYSKTMPVREITDSVENVLKVALRSMNPVKALESLGNPEIPQQASITAMSVSKPVMPGTSLEKVLAVAEEYGVIRAFSDTDFGHDTQLCALQNSSGGLLLSVVYDSVTMEVLCGGVVTINELASISEQESFINGICSVLCPVSDESNVSSWVGSNVGGSAITTIGDFEYELDLGPDRNLLYNAGISGWEEWDASVN